MTNLIKAIIEFQKEVSAIKKNATNPFHKSKYASLDSILDTVKPLLCKFDLAIVYKLETDKLTTILYHSSGENIFSELPLNTAQKIQELGSQITYFKRYSISSLLSLATEDDDDGNFANIQKAMLNTENSLRWLTQEEFEKIIFGLKNLDKFEITKKWYNEFKSNKNNGLSKKYRQEIENEIQNQLK